jgi:soluble lytic murein transglycosylase-like protein
VRRAPLIALLGLLPSALSCAFLSGPGALLPPVGAPPVARQAGPAAAEPDPAQVAAIERLLLARRTGLTRPEVARLAHTVVREAERRALEPRLVIAVMAVESGFYNFAVSPVGAMGLMQVMPATGAELAEREGIHWSGPATLFDPIVNVRLGVAYLRELADRYGQIHVALAAYNWGPGRIDRRLRRGVPLPVDYPQLVQDAYERHQGRVESRS